MKGGAKAPGSVPAEKQVSGKTWLGGAFSSLPLRYSSIEVLTIWRGAGEISIMPKGVPYRVQVSGKGTRTYTFTEIAAGTGMSVSIVSLILRGKRPISEYAKRRLAAFLGVSAGESFTINVCTPPPRTRGRLVGRIRPGSPYPGPPVLDRYAASQKVGPQESEEESDNWLRARLPGEK